MSNKLTEAQLGRRLGSGLKMQWISSTTGEKYNHELTISDFDFLRKRDAKPILRSLDSLTKPITHKGETFVPIERLTDFCNPIYFKDKIKPYVNQFCFLPENLPYWVIEKLIEWNFVIDEPEGSYIKAEELEPNPYEV